MTLQGRFLNNFSNSLLGMVNDKYGNYVVQKLIEVADFHSKENIIQRISYSNSHKRGDGFCILFF